jgi:hypothetical protein
VDPANTVTFTKDIAPIFYNRCAECHRREIAPMSLLTHAESRPGPRLKSKRLLISRCSRWHLPRTIVRMNGVSNGDRYDLAWVGAGAQEGETSSSSSSG